MDFPFFKCDDITVNKAYRLATACLAANTVTMQSGVLSRPESCVMAGLDYDTPWTRDAAINVMNAVAALSCEAAKNTLLSVLEEGNGKVFVGGQYWDCVIWGAGAYKYYQYSGDTDFLKTAYKVLKATLKKRREEEFDGECNLFRGPAVYGDGVAAYPQKYHNEDFSSAIWTWQDSHPEGRNPNGYGLPMFALSTNCLYAETYKILAEMSELLNEDSAWYRLEAGKLIRAINKCFWNEERGSYDYLYKESDAQEGLGLAFAVLFGVADEEKIESIMKNVHITGYGIPCVYPAFKRYRKYGYGRHSGTVWPHVQGFWAMAALSAGRKNLFDKEFFALGSNAVRDMQFTEIYHPETGEPYGGVQEEIVNGEKVYKIWKSCDYQTWSATAYLNMILEGICGIRPDGGELSFKPYLPAGISRAEISDFKYRGIRYDVEIVRADSASVFSESIGGDYKKIKISIGD